MATIVDDEMIPETKEQRTEGIAIINNDDLDDAYSFLLENAAFDSSGVDMKLVRRKIDRRLIPLLFFIHLMLGIDAHLLNYAIVMGLPEDLHLKGQQLNNIASSIHWVHLAAMVIVGVYLNKFPLGKSLGWSMLIWGSLVTCTAAVKNYEQMLAIRILMGVFDCLFQPAMMLITSQFYRKDEQLTRFQLWWCSTGFAQILGALISYGLQFVHATSFSSWQIMYLVLGLVTIVISSWAVTCLPDSPMQARFLSREEKVAVLRHVSVNATGVSSHRIKPKQILSVFTDIQVWLLTSSVLLTGFGVGILATYGSTLIQSFGYSPKESTLLQAPGGAISIIACFITAWILRGRYLQRWSTIALSYAVALLGACLVAFPAHKNQGAHLAGIFLFSFSSATVGIKFQWNAANVAGHSKRPVTMTIMGAAFTAGQIAGPYAVQKTEAPNYSGAKYSIVASKVGCLVLVCSLALYYLLANRRRDRIYGKPVVRESESDEHRVEEYSSPEVWANLTDKEREKTFRYLY